MKTLKELLLIIAISVAGVLLLYPLIGDRNSGPYYFACLKKGDKEFVVKTEKIPTVAGGIVTFEDGTVWFPPADTYCRTVKVSSVEKTAQSAP